MSKITRRLLLGAVSALGIYYYKNPKEAKKHKELLLKNFQNGIDKINELANDNIKKDEKIENNISENTVTKEELNNNSQLDKLIDVFSDKEEIPLDNQEVIIEDIVIEEKLSDNSVELEETIELAEVKQSVDEEITDKIEESKDNLDLILDDNNVVVEDNNQMKEDIKEEVDKLMNDLNTSQEDSLETSEFIDNVENVKDEELSSEDLLDKVVEYIESEEQVLMDSDSIDSNANVKEENISEIIKKIEEDNFEKLEETNKEESDNETKKALKSIVEFFSLENK